MPVRELSPSGPQSRAIRVFISSNFRDMHGERDELVKRAFPQVRKLCDRRGVAWTEVDLRWGVTDEQTAEGKVLAVCLAEIKNCRPFFIGLIGERYGWVPEVIPPNLIEGEPWLNGLGGRSVTELEILHGVLNNPEMAGHAFFYLRDSSYLEQLPPAADRRDFVSESPASAEKLARLKDRIRSSGFPVREGYRNPRELADLVFEDLHATVDRLFPEGSEPDPLDREMAEHEAFARARAQVFVARPADFQTLDDHADGDGAPLVVLGESGSGKSALLANWALSRAGRRPGEVLLMHFVGATPESTDAASMLRRVAGELKRRCGLTRQIPDRSDQLQAEFGDWLAAAAETARVVLVIDALNQFEDRDGAADLSWLRQALPSNVRVVVSTLPGRALDEAVRRGWPSLFVEPLRPVEREALVVSYLGHYSKTLSPARVRLIVQSEATANPLYLRALLEELRVFGVHERLDEHLAYYLAAATPEDLHARILRRYQADYERDRPGLVREAMALIWAARQGLSEAELLGILGRRGAPLPRAHWAPLALAAEPMLVNRSGLLRFSHDYVREAVRQEYLPRPRDQRTVHRRLADHFEHRRVGRRRLPSLRWLPVLMFLLVYAAIAGGLLRLLDALYEEGGKTTFERLLLVPPAIMVLVVSVALSLWTVWGLARMVRATGDRISRWVSRRRSRGGSEPDGPTPRSVDELPWQLARAGDWWRLYDLLRDPRFFRRAWELNPFRVMAYWRDVETGTYGTLGRLMARTRELNSAFRDLFGGRALDAYRRVLSDPVAHRDQAPAVAQLLVESGHAHESSSLIDRLVRYDERRDDTARLATALVLQAEGFRAQHYSVATMAAYTRARRFCGTSGAAAPLSRCLEGLASAFLERDALDDALSLTVEAERAARGSGDTTALARALITRASVHRARGEPADARDVLDDAERHLRSIGNRADLVRALDLKSLVLADLGDPRSALDVERRAALLRAELGVSDAPAPPGSATELLDSRLAALRRDEQEYRRTGRKVLLAQTLVEQAYHWAVLRRFPLAAKPLALKASKMASRYRLDDLLTEFRPVLDATAPSVAQLAGNAYWRARPETIWPTLKVLFFGAGATWMLYGAITSALPVLSFAGLNPVVDIRSMPPETWVLLWVGLFLAMATSRNVHALVARPYFITSSEGLALRHWRIATEAMTSRVLARFFLPVHHLEHAAVAWSEIRGLRVERGFGGFKKALIIETDWGDLEVGRVLLEGSDRLRQEVFEAARYVAKGIPELAGSLVPAIEKPEPVRTSAQANASLMLGISGLCIPLLAGLLAVLLGHRALKAIRSSGGTLRGEARARWGLILGYLSIMLFIVVIITQKLYKYFQNS